MAVVYVDLALEAAEGSRYNTVCYGGGLQLVWCHPSIQFTYNMEVHLHL